MRCLTTVYKEVKGEVHARSGHEIPETYNSTLSLSSALDADWW